MMTSAAAQAVDGAADTAMPAGPATPISRRGRGAASALPARRTRRISGQQAFVLHQYPYSESSLIVDLFTRDHGRLMALAKGAKKPTSNFRALLLPLQLLRLDCSWLEQEQGVIATIRSVERAGGPAVPRGEPLLAGLYLNELLARLLVRGDAHAAVFDAYQMTLHVLASAPGQALEVLLRAFELVLLQQLGMLPDLSVQTQDQQPLGERKRYALIPEMGLHEVWDGRRSLSGQQWQAIAQALAGPQALAACMRALGDAAADLKPQLRAALAHYLGAELHTQRLMRGLRTL